VTGPEPEGGWVGRSVDPGAGGVVGDVGVPGRLVGLEVNDKVGFGAGVGDVGAEGVDGAEATAGVGELSWDSIIHQTPATIPPPSKKAKTAKMIKTTPLLEESSSLVT